MQSFKGLPNTLLQIEEHLKYLSELKDKFKDNEEIQIEYKKCIDRNSNIYLLKGIKERKKMRKKI